MVNGEIDDETLVEEQEVEGMEITALVTRLNEEFTDKRVIVGIDIPDEVDIPIRDLHSSGDGYGRIVGLTNKDKITFNEKGEMFAGFTVTDDKFAKLVKTAKYPEKFFQYSPELKNPKRVGFKRSGVLSGIAITPTPAWNGSKTKEIRFQKLDNSDEFFEDQTDTHTKEEINVTGKDELFETKIELKDAQNQIEKFETENLSLKEEMGKVQEDFESQIKEITEDFESKVKTLEAEKQKVTEDFEILKKDNEDLKTDYDCFKTKVEEFESKEKMSLVEKVFEAGSLIEMDGFEEENKEKKVEELFGISEDRLMDKKADYENFASKVPAKTGPTGVKKQEQRTGSTRSHFRSLFE